MGGNVLIKFFFTVVLKEQVSLLQLYSELFIDKFGEWIRVIWLLKALYLPKDKPHLFRKQ